MTQVSATKNFCFDMHHANQLLLDGLPESVQHNELIIYDRPYIGPAERSLNRQNYEKYKSLESDRLKSILIKNSVDTDHSDWLNLIKTLDSKLKYPAYAYFYWTNKNNPSITRYIKSQSCYEGLPYFKKDHQCEVCGHSFKIKYSKLSRTSLSPCDVCGHTPQSQCVCTKCGAYDLKIAENVNKLIIYTDNWICDRDADVSKAAKEYGIDASELRTDIREYILDQWKIEYFSGFSKICTSLSRYDHDKSVIFKRISYFGCKFEFDIVNAIRQRVDFFCPTAQNTNAGKTPGRTRKGHGIYVLSTSPESKGYQDFCAIVENKVDFTPVFFNSSDSLGLYAAISSLGVINGDIVVIVRGGGDIEHETFKAFRSTEAANAIRAIRVLGITVISGIGHASDEFIVQSEASIPAITPTDAAYKLLRKELG